MKKLYVIILLSFTGLISNAQIVYIPDTNFKNALLADTSINTNRDTSIQLSEAIAFTGTMVVDSLSISDLTGIEAFTALTGLNCDFNNLINLNLSSNTALTSLSCTNNVLLSLNVSSNTALQYLNCFNNGLTSLDLSSNRDLNFINCSAGWQLIDLFLPNGPVLETLICNWCELSNLDVSLNISLNYLDCYHNSLTNLNISSNKAISYFYCGHNHLTNLDLSIDSALITVDCNYNQLTNLDVSTNRLLDTLICYNNKLTNLNLSSNTNLIWLNCPNNIIKTLDLSSNESLVAFFCENNNLLSLNVKNGNNHNLIGDAINTTNNDSLFCIQVDDTTYLRASWPFVDPWTNFSTDCHYVGVNEIENVSNVNLYPNPFSTKVIVELKDQRARSLSIYNTLGEIVNFQKLMERETIIDVDNEPSGIYYIRIITDDGKTIVKKIIKL